MPYIKDYQRPQCDKAVEALKENKVQPNGMLNYVLFKYCKDTIAPSYNEYKNYIGELNETVAEIRRRFLAPYEDKKIEENGDV